MSFLYILWNCLVQYRTNIGHFYLAKMLGFFFFLHQNLVCKNMRCGLLEYITLLQN
uniref:Uncharacterized protein n=1 Tax=Mus musculus TaxID=10090 RepID=Q3UVZ4_MOUSE|nr:unnamed protein product [Mus musculus]